MITPKKSKKSIGYTGESIACVYLEHKNCRIIDRNYFTKFGEIDIIAKTIDKTLVFCEVKTISSIENSTDTGNKDNDTYTQESGKNVQKLGKVWQSLAIDKYSQSNDSIRPEDQMSYSKINNFKKTSKWYANRNLKKIGCNNYRLDLIAVDLFKDKANVRWYKNVL